MNITFMIGNGFDLRMGMKTRYTDMYEGYVGVNEYEEFFGVFESFMGERGVLEKFKRLLRGNRLDNYRNWSDFEMAMATYAREFEKEDDFIICVRDFKEYMAEYLKNEEDKFMLYLESYIDSVSVCTKEFGRSISQFYYGQIPNDKNRIKKLFNSDPITFYKFISFNYTTVLDYYLELYKNAYNINGGEIVHIHGSLGENVVLGIDSVEQFDDLKFMPTPKLGRAFIKPEFNSRFDSERVEQAEKMISDSNVICIYGMSLGESDRTWINYICEWLLENPNHHLVYFQYSEDKFSNIHSDRKMDEEEERKQRLLEKMFQEEAERESVFDQVHIPVGFDIFDFKNKLEETTEVLEINV